MGTKGGPPAKKPPGTAVNHRQNGQRAVLTELGEPFDLPEDVKHPKALEAWEQYWNDPVSSLLTKADRSVVVRWITLCNRYWTLLDEADAEPTVASGANGLLAHPLYKVALAMENQIERLENKLGISPKARALLGIQILGFEKGKKEFERGSGPSPEPIPDDEEDPRL